MEGTFQSTSEMVQEDLTWFILVRHTSNYVRF
jgi:hypothetical protein